MEKPLVSVTMPSYNHAPWLGDAIESVLAQSYPNVELVVVDDGSADGSLEIANAYAAREPERVRVYTHAGGANRGTSATTNRAIREARGELWGALGSDDRWLPHKLERQVALLEQNPGWGFVWARSEPIDEHGRRIPEVGILGWDAKASRRPLESMLTANPVPALTALVRLDRLLESAPRLLREDLAYQDWHLWIRLAARNGFGFDSSVLAQSRVHAGNVSWNRAATVDRARTLAVLEAIHDEAGSIGGGLAEPRTAAVLALEIARHRFALGDAGGAEAAVTGLSAASSADLPSRLRRYCVPGPTADADAEFSRWLTGLLPAVLPSRMERRRRAIESMRAASVAASDGRRSRSLRLCARAARLDPSWLLDRGFVGLLARTVGIGRLRALGRRLSRSSRPTPS